LWNEKFREVKQSIQNEGIISPLLVQIDKEKKGFKLIDGRRRLQAASQVGMKKVPVIVYDENQNKIELLSIIANTNQQNLSPIELGMAYQRLLDNSVYASKRQLANALGTSESTVGTRINNLKLDTRVLKNLIETKSINDQKVLKAIRVIEEISEEGISDKQWDAYNHIVDNKLNRTDALKYIQELRGETETSRTVSLSDSKIDLSFDMSGWDEEKVSKVNALLAEIEAIRQEAEESE